MVRPSPEPAAARLAPLLMLVLGALGSAGCATATIEPGHRGLFFSPSGGGLQRELLQPGRYNLGFCFLHCTSNRIEDFDVTYTSKVERLQVPSSEGITLNLELSVIYRPIVSELYQLDTEIGPRYYDEVIGPEFLSASRSVFEHHSVMDLRSRNEAIENEIEDELRRRVAGKHVEVSAVNLQRAAYAPEVAEAIQRRLLVETEAARARAVEDAEFARKERALEHELELRRLAEAPACASSMAAPAPSEAGRPPLLPAPMSSATR
jgi:regulator of protease activity HflC (stomatin/prohibitin superfamily)